MAYLIPRIMELALLGFHEFGIQMFCKAFKANAEMSVQRVGDQTNQLITTTTSIVVRFSKPIFEKDRNKLKIF